MATIITCVVVPLDRGTGYALGIAFLCWALLVGSLGLVVTT